MNAMTEMTAPAIQVGLIDDAALHAFLAHCADATPFHDPRWGRAVERATGHHWLVLGARDAVGELIGVLPMHVLRSRLFGHALASTGFAVDGGILAEDARVVAALADAALAQAAELGIGHVALRGGPAPADWAVDDATYVGYSRALAPDSEAELAAIPRKHRAEVRKALANPLSVTTGRAAADRRAHYAVYAESVRNLGTPVFPRALFDAVLDAFGDDADILTVRHDGTPVASVLSLYWRGTVMPYWGGGTRAARGLRANERMYFALMDHARGRGMTSFDFGRSKAGSGPAAYKKNWGFEASPLTYAHWSAAGETRDTNPTSAKYRLMVDSWQKMPLWLANRLGPLIARQLG
jgi:FemAB-related protein (PEP-CTERM system-associated)